MSEKLSYNSFRLSNDFLEYQDISAAFTVSVIATSYIIAFTYTAEVLVSIPNENRTV